MKKERLLATTGSTSIGTLEWDRDKDRLSFRYDETWENNPSSFPVSLSMPMHGPAPGHENIENFLWGLLPDNPGVLKRWGEKFQVSPRHAFQLMSHVGEECAGAVQFVRPAQLEAWMERADDTNVRWLKPDNVDERIQTILNDHSATRTGRDTGQFSLAGAQPKIALHYDPQRKRWGVPEGNVPTTHILKPATGHFDGLAENEHFCLCLANALDFTVPKSQVVYFGGNPVIVVTRYDRRRIRDEVVRIHQEDICQALGRHPDKKYQSDGGPTPIEIVALLREYSTKSEEDVWRFFDALVYNWLIAGTDAHAKNYSLLIASGGQVRLAPLYDISSTLPYPKTVDPRRARLAMKIGGKYLLRGKGGVSASSWEKCANELELDLETARDRILKLAEKLPDSASMTAGELKAKGLTHEVLGRLVSSIGKWTKECVKTMGRATDNSAENQPSSQ